MHLQGKVNKSEIDPHQVHMSGDVSMTCLSNIRTQPLAENLIQDTRTVLVANGQ